MITEKEMIDALSKTSNIKIDDSIVVKAYDDATEAMKSFNEKFGEDFSKKQQKLLNKVSYCRNLQLSILAAMVFVGIVGLFLAQKSLTIINLILLFVMCILSWCMVAFERDYWKNRVEEKDTYIDFLFKEFYCSIITTERKCRTFKKVYEDAYTVMRRIPTTELEAAKKEVGVDFSYLQKEIEFLEKLTKKEDE